MSEVMHCAALRENPELFRIILQNTIDEITACMSDECSTTLFKEPEAEDLLKQAQFLQEKHKNFLSKAINDIWNQHQISQKASFIHQLQLNYPSDFIAWRPTCGEVPIVNLRGHYLTNTIGRFLYKMKQIETESEELKKTLGTKTSATRKSLNNISKAEESLTNFHNNYDKIIREDN